MKLLLLTKYSVLGASSRLRTLQYTQRLIGSGWAVETQHLFDNKYVERLYAKKSRFLLVIWLYLRRSLYLFGKLIREEPADVLLVEKEIFPGVPFWIERIFYRIADRCVVDYDDAIFHNYDTHPSSVIRWALGEKIASVMRRADVVFVGNDYIRRYARNAGAGRIVLVPTALNTAKYFSRTRPAGSPVVIGWIGTQYTSKYVGAIERALERAAATHALEVRLVGPLKSPFARIRATLVPWSEASEADSLADIDVGIMPLPDRHFERGKCGYKLLQYMAAGKPVIASPVGVNCEIVLPGQNGLLASSEDEWTAAITALAQDADTRQRLGKRGHDIVRHGFDVEVIGRTISTELSDLLALESEPVSRGTLVVSLDLEMGWGVRERLLRGAYRENVRNEPGAVDGLLNLFAKYNVHATWAVVGAMMCNDERELQPPTLRNLPHYSTLPLAEYLVAPDTLKLDRELYFCPDIHSRIARVPGQELGTHTFLHYFCRRTGGTLPAFKDDLNTAIAQFENKTGARPRSIVFPRNEINDECLAEAGLAGIRCYRGNRPSWIPSVRWKAARRIFSAIDAVVGLTGTDVFSLADVWDRARFNVRESYMLRFFIWSHWLQRLVEWRAIRALKRAARERKILHLWWHPHNMGADLGASLRSLERILREFARLRDAGMIESKSMIELAETCPLPAAEIVENDPSVVGLGRNP